MNTSSKTVMAFGTFDGLHPGHINYFEQARRYGERLLVVVARDRNVKRLKGRTPRQTEQERLDAVQAAAGVDAAMLGYEGSDFYAIIKDYNPDVLTLGYDQKADLTALQAAFPNITIVRLEPYQPEKYKSSLLNMAL